MAASQNSASKHHHLDVSRSETLEIYLTLPDLLEQQQRRGLLRGIEMLHRLFMNLHGQGWNHSNIQKAVEALVADGRVFQQQNMNDANEWNR